MKWRAGLWEDRQNWETFSWNNWDREWRRHNWLNHKEVCTTTRVRGTQGSLGTREHQCTTNWKTSELQGQLPICLFCLSVPWEPSCQTTATSRPISRSWDRIQFVAGLKNRVHCAHFFFKKDVWCCVKIKLAVGFGIMLMAA